MQLLNHIVLSLKSWLRTPVVFGLAVLMLAVGIGASVASYGFLQGALLQPLRVKNPHQLMRVMSSSFSLGMMTPGDYYDLIEYSEVFEDSFMSLLHWSVNFQIEDDVNLIKACEISGRYFDVLGIDAIMGRTITPEDDERGAEPVVVISERFWRNQLNARENIVGASIQLNGRPATVVGVIPAAFHGTYRMTQIDVWFPHSQVFEGWRFRLREMHTYPVILRVDDGVEMARIRDELNGFSEYIRNEFPGTRSTYSLRIVSEQEAVMQRHSTLAKQSYFILAILLGLLLIACANVSNILLAKVNARRNEIAVRRAFGAGSRSVMALLITDGMVLAMLGACGGILLAYLFVHGFMLLDMRTSTEEAINASAMWFFAGITLLIGFLCGIFPAIQAVRVNINEVLKESSRTSTRFRAGGTLIVIQVAFSLILLIGSGLFVRSLQEANRVDPGHRTEHILAFNLDLNHIGGRGRADVMSFSHRLAEVLEQNPDIISVGLVSRYTLLRGSWSSITWNPELDIPDGSELWTVHHVFFGPGFLETMDIEIIEGRAPTAEEYTDRWFTTGIINESMAQRFWSDQNPVGREFIPWGGKNSKDRIRVIGVCRDFRLRLSEPPQPLFMVIGLENRFKTIVHTRVAPEIMKPVVTRLLAEFEPSLPVPEFSTIDESQGRALRDTRAGFVIMSLVSILGLIISVTGIYASLNNWIQRSMREIGLRMALGAAPGVVRLMYILRGLMIVFMGVVTGLVLASLSIPFVRDIFFNVSPWDPITFVVVPFILLIAAFVACYLSTRRVMRIDPVTALRIE